MRILPTLLIAAVSLSLAACDTSLPVTPPSGLACDAQNACSDGFTCHPTTKKCLAKNHPPSVGLTNVDVTATGPTTPVSLDASSAKDADGDRLTFTWKEGATVLSTKETDTVSFAKGAHALTLTVSDGFDTTDAAMTVTVENAVPTVTLSDVELVATGPTTTVTLDASSATDPDGDALTFDWSEAGETLSTDRVATVAFAKGAHAITLTVSDGTATVTAGMTVTIDNVPPTVTVADQTLVATGPTTPVSLDASSAADVDGDALTFSWMEGDTILSTKQVDTVALAKGVHALRLTVSDGEASATATPTITIQNAEPVAVAGPDRSVSAGSDDTATVTLDGSQSRDPDGDALSFAWKEGDTVLATTATASVKLSLGTHALELDVSDGTVTKSATTHVTVETPPALAGTLSAPSAVSIGQQFEVTLAAQDTGEAGVATLTPGTLSWTGSAEAAIVSGPAPASEDVAGGASGAFTWEVKAATAGSLTFKVDAAGKDHNDGTTPVALAPVQTQPVEVTHGAALVASLLTDASPVDLGKTFGVRLRVTNNGQTSALGVAPSTPSEAGAGGATLASGPTPAKKDLAGGETVEFAWTYVASRGGSVVFSGSAAGTDANSGGTVSSPGATAAELTIQAPANVSTALATSRTSIDVGQALTVTMTVKNDRTGDITNVAPTLTNDCPTCLNATGGPTPPQVQTLAPGGSQTFTWTFEGAARGELRLSGGASFQDPSGAYEASGSRTGTILVQTPASLAIAGITAPARMDVGQQGAKGQLSIVNGGDADASVDQLTLAFASDAGSVMTATLGEELPVTVPGGQTVQVPVTFGANANAPAGPVTVSATGSGTDLNTGASGDLTAGATTTVTLDTPAALQVASVSSPFGRVSQGQSADVSAVVQNTGSAAAQLGTAGLRFTLSGQDRATDYTVTPAANNPTSIPGGRSATFQFTVQVAPTAQTGSLAVDATLPGTDVDSGGAITAAGAANPLAWAVQTPAKPVVTALTPGTGAVTQGQQNAPLDVTIANQGDADLTVSDAKVAFTRAGADASAGFTVTRDPQNPTTVAGHSTADLRFKITVASDTAPGDVTVGASYAGTDANSGAETTSTGPATPVTWTVDTPARLVVASLVAPSTVSQGDTVAVSYDVQNTGGAAATLDDADLAFAAGATSLQDEYAVAPDPANPATLAGGQTATLHFSVTALSTATTGTEVTVTPVVVASDANTGNAATVDSSTSASWIVSTAAHLAISTVRSGTNLQTQKVSQGEKAVPVTVHVTNTGTTDSVIDSIGLTFKTSTGTDRSASFTATASGTNPSTVNGGGSADFHFTVDVTAGASTGAIIVGATLTAHQSGGGESVTPTGPESPATWTVQTPASLRIVSAAAGAQTVSQGETGVAVTVQVANQGQAAANVSSVRPTFENGGDAGAQYTVHQASGNPTSIAGGQTATFSFTVDVAQNATEGQVGLDAAATGADANSAAALTASGAATPGSFVVQSPAALVLDRVTVAATNASLGQSGVGVTVTAHDAGGATVDLQSAALVVRLGAADRTADYVVRRTDSTATVAHGDTATLTFQLAVKSTAATGTVTVDATANGADANTGGAANSPGATTTGQLVVQRPAALTATVAVTPDVVQADDPSNRTVTVSMAVKNTGEAVAQNVLPTTLTVGGSGSATLASGPTPSAPQQLAGGQTATFSWTYTATGTCEITFQGHATGVDANSGAQVAAPDGTSPQVAVKKLPIADAGADFSAFLDDRVKLDGTKSTPGDCDPASTLTYSWTPEGANPYAVTLDSATTSAPTFDARGAAQLAFDLTVTAQNPTRSSTSTVVVTVLQFAPLDVTGVSSTGLSMRGVAFDGAGRLAASTDDYAWMHDSSWHKLATLASASGAAVVADAQGRFWFGYAASNKVERVTYDWTGHTGSVEQAVLTTTGTAPTKTNAIALSPSGDAWFATDVDLFELPGADPQATLARKNPQGSCGLGTSCRQYFSVAFDAAGALHAGDTASLFSSSDGFSTFSTDDVSPNRNDTVHAIAAGAGDELWVGSAKASLGTQNGLSRLADATKAHPWAPADFTNYTTTTTPAITGNDVRAIATDANGDVWIATDGGISRWNRARGELENYAGGTNGLPASVDARAIALDDQGGRRTVAVATGTGVYVLQR